MPTLGEEIRQQKPFRSEREEALLGIMRTSDRVSIAQARMLREYGLSLAQYNILRILRGASEPLPCLEVADRMITVVPAITRLMDDLEQKKLVERKRSPEDRRVVLAAIRKPGRALLASLDAPIESLCDELMSGLNKGETRHLIGLLDKVRDGLA